MGSRARLQTFNTVRRGPSTALLFPTSSGLSGDGCVFDFSTGLFPQTPWGMIWRVKYVYQVSYYTLAFYNNNFGGGFANGPGDRDDGYIGPHPYPDGGAGGTTHKWELSMDFHDTVSSIAVDYGVWKTQFLRVTGTLLRPIADFYYDFGNSLDKVTYTYGTDWIQSATPHLTFGDNPWPAEASEAMCGYFRGLQIYAGTGLTVANAQVEATNDYQNTPLTAEGIANVWHMNQNPVDQNDISDKSGQGHNPSWLNARRPTLVTL